jgi:energy-coupling factor transporter transmembrane protein EcfT
LAVFAATLIAFQWLNGTVDLSLPLRTVAVFVISTAAFRAIPWAWLARRIAPGSPFYDAALFLLFIRHFTAILMEESRRTLQARALVVRGSFGRGGFSSLRWALVALLRRVLVRAERFYAAQLCNGAAR